MDQNSPNLFCRLTKRNDLPPHATYRNCCINPKNGSTKRRTMYRQLLLYIEHHQANWCGSKYSLYVVQLRYGSKFSEIICSTNKTECLPPHATYRNCCINPKKWIYKLTYDVQTATTVDRAPSGKLVWVKIRTVRCAATLWIKVLRIYLFD